MSRMSHRQLNNVFRDLMPEEEAFLKEESRLNQESQELYEETIQDLDQEETK